MRRIFSARGAYRKTWKASGCSRRVSAPHTDDLAAFPSCPIFVHDLLHVIGIAAVGIEDLTAEGSGVAFVTAAPKSLGEPMEAAIHAFITAHDGGRIDVSKTCDLFGKTLIPDFPSQSLRQPGSDGTLPHPYSRSTVKTRNMTFSVLPFLRRA